MSFEPRDYLRHILLEAEYILSQTPGLPFDAFVANPTLSLAPSSGAWRLSGKRRRRCRLTCARSIQTWTGEAWPECATD